MPCCLNEEGKKGRVERRGKGKGKEEGEEARKGEDIGGKGGGYIQLSREEASK